MSEIKSKKEKSNEVSQDSGGMLAESLKAFRILLAESEARHEKRQEESEKRHEKRQDEADKRQGEAERRNEKRQDEADKRHEKQSAEISKGLEVLIKATSELTTSHKVSKKDREIQSKEMENMKVDYKDLRKLYHVLNNDAILTKERQSNNTNSLGKFGDIFHKVATSVMAAYIIYLMNFKGGG